MNKAIEKNRMTEAILTIVKADGTLLSNQEVVLEQTRYKFLFGTAAFVFVPLISGDYSGEKKEQAEQRAEKINALYNAARWCLDHNMVTKGHPLCWHTVTADWLLELSNAEVCYRQVVFELEPARFFAPVEFR
jgi:hypothetical protein